MSGARLRPGQGGAHELVLDGGSVTSEQVVTVVEEGLAAGAQRVEVRVAAADVDTVRALSRAGLRREGVLRGPDGDDRLLMARLAGDPAPGTREGFVAMLNAGLPRKRVIAQGLLHDDHGRVLLCELTYKAEWDLPGGVVEPGESPRDGVVREVREELGIEVSPRSLRTVNWLPPWRQWDDACVFVFDLGEVPSSIVDDLVLQPTEIVAVHWCDPATVASRAAAATATLLADLAAEATSVDDAGAGAPYREAGTAPPPP